MTDFTDAACRPYVKAGEDYWHQDGPETERGHAQRVALAKAICSDCPLADPCAREATAHDWGIWSGRTQPERATGDLACGDKQGHITGANRHRRARQPLCGPCRDAKRIDDRERWRAKRVGA